MPSKKTTAKKTTRKKTTGTRTGSRRGPESKSSARNLRNAEREVKVFELRRQGLTLQQIADVLGYADRSGPAQAIDRVMKRLFEDAEHEADHWRALLTARLEAMLAGPSIAEVIEQHGITADAVNADDRGDTEGAFGLMARAMAGQLGAVDRVVTIIEKLAKLHGAYAPERVEHTGAEGGPIEHTEMSATEFMKSKLEEMSQRLKEKESATRSSSRKKTTTRKPTRRRGSGRGGKK